MKRTADRMNRPQPRRGFSLIELLAVIIVIGILVSLLFPAINSVRRRAQITQVSAELTQIDTAIASFSSSGAIGAQPWSELILVEDPSTIPSLAPAVQQRIAVSQSRLRRMFEGMNFTVQHDLNGDADKADLLELTGSECLVFFLGGILSSKDLNNNNVLETNETTVKQALTGFSKNPVDPFTRAGSNRLGPYFTFDAARLIDTDGDGMLEYLDATPNQKTAYHFASSNNGQGYDSTVQIYVQSDGKTPWNKDGHQLISPGADGAFGFTTTRNTFAVGATVTGEAADNIANFKPGTTLGE
jgi:prepilin-type N-terminal cleavage/methylation domain-containing protein